MSRTETGPTEGGSTEGTIGVQSDSARAMEGATERRIFQRLDTTAGFPYPLKWYVRRVLWEVVERTLFRWSPKRANGFRRMLLGWFGARLAPTVVLRRSATIKHPWLLAMGEYSCLAEDVEIYNLGPVRIGEHTVISQYAYVCNGTHDYTKPDLPLVRPECEIGSGVWVCAGAFVGPGVRIGDNAIVGARAVVMRDVPGGMIVSGNPAKVVKERAMDFSIGGEG